MAEKDWKSLEDIPHDHPVDQQDVTPPHGDELRTEGTSGRPDRHATQDDPDAEAPVLEAKSLIADDDELSAEARRRRMDEIDDAAADDARRATRKREHSAE
jgi:hypothetical protein